MVDLTPADPPVVDGGTPTNDTTPEWTWSSGGGDGNSLFRYKLDDADLTSGATETAETTFTPDSALTEETHTLYVQERDEAGNWSESGSFDIVVDVTAPDPPVVDGVTPTNDTTPDWTWVSGGGGGNGTYRYKLDDTDLSVESTETTDTGFTPLSSLAAGEHTLYVQELDEAGNWSDSGSFVIVVDVTAPEPPVVDGITPTNDTTPAWTWSSGGGDGIGTYRYKLDDDDLDTGAVETTAAGFTPEAVQTEGPHTLYVQERDQAGNWSSTGSRTIVVDITAPGEPVVAGTTPTNDTTPAWTWSSGGGEGNGTYRYKLDDDDLTSGATQTTTTEFSPDEALTEETHTLYVEERDEAGNWSESGSFGIVVDVTAPDPPVVGGVTPTNDTTPTWTWSSGGGDGIGTYRYKLDDDDLTSDATETTATEYSPLDVLTEGLHTLYVQERDEAGNWSASGQFNIIIDITIPPAPAVSGTTPTNDTTPGWSWVSGGGDGWGLYRYKLDDDDLSDGAVETDETDYTSPDILTEGTHVLYVQERDEAGNWSESGSFAVVVDLEPPDAPVVDGLTLTNDTIPTWTWYSGGGGGWGIYRYELDDDDLSAGATETIEKVFAPSVSLSEGMHTLYVQERDEAGNWSDSGSFTTEVDITPPDPPDLSGLTPTNDTTPSWNWVTGGNGGTGTYRY